MKQRSKFLLLALVSLILVASTAIFFFCYTNHLADSDVVIEDDKLALEQRIEPELYQLTVPYLRNRGYSSHLSNLEKLRETTDYEVFLTSYDSDGLRINGLLTIPKGERPDAGWPAIVFLHGYQNPATYQTDGQPYSAYWAYLARQGFIVFKIDLRGHGESEGRASGAYYSSDYVIDTLNAYFALAVSDFVNPAKIYLWGHSMTGNTVLRTLAARPEIPRAVIWAGAVYTYADMAQYGIQDSSFVGHATPAPIPTGSSASSGAQRSSLRTLIDKYHGSNATLQSDPFWRAFVPANYLGEIKTKIALFHAINDDVVSVNYSRDLRDLAASTSADIILYEYPTGGHNLSSPTFEQAMRETVKFLQGI